jgi:hypothetical protein
MRYLPIKTLLALAAAMGTSIASGAGPTTSQNPARPRTQIVVVHTAEPTPAAHLHKSVSGICFGRSVSVEFPYDKVDAKPAIKVTVAGRSRVFNTSQAFVRDLYDPSKAYRMGLWCDTDRIELTAVGVSISLTGTPGTQSAKYVSSALWRASVSFARNGSFLRYSGLQPF